MAKGDSKAFNVRVGLHQGSVLIPLLFMVFIVGRFALVAVVPVIVDGVREMSGQNCFSAMEKGPHYT